MSYKYYGYSAMTRCDTSPESSEEEDYEVEPDIKLVAPPLPSRQSDMLERARYIPLRLTHTERIRLHILEAALTVNQYTDKVDISSGQLKKKLLKTRLKDISAIMSGLLVASNYQEGQKLVKEKDFSQNLKFFQTIFEIGRRHKIMNPEKMRSEYGKLVYLLQDAVSPQIQQLLGFNTKMGIKTVYSYFEKRGILNILQDKRIDIVTKEILPDSSKDRYNIQKEIKLKEKTLKALCSEFKSSKISEEEIKYGIYSLTDNNSFLNSNAEPINQMLKYLAENFDPKKPEEGFSLEIQAGHNGARLSHSHEHQFNYVYQSLLLWKEIMENMFMLWFLSEDDLISTENPYELKDTGQGLNRVQAAPQCKRAMQAILAKTQQSVSQWVGSSVIHLGDHNVPNALMFIDKYTQVPRILVPIVTAIKNLDKLMNSDETSYYIETAFGGKNKLKKTILTDFFRFGFDGSGADNFVDAGSCIDGRLTSAWNWCSQLEQKDYYPIFLLSGFIGFDGDFQK